MKREREYRSFEFEKTDDFKVEGYASTFEPYVLFSDGDVDYSERIEPEAFDETDMSDVVFRIDHTGPVYARTSAGTVEIDVDEHGLHNIIDLSRTEKARGIFEDVRAGNYPQMSFAFTVAEGGDEYDADTHTRVIKRIEKLYDVSAVSFPANPGTELNIYQRAMFDGVIEREKAERLLREKETLKRDLMKEITKWKLET